MKLEEILHQAEALNASDIHLSVGKVPFFRIDGELRSVIASTINALEMETIVAGILSKQDYLFLTEHGEVDCAWEWSAKPIKRCRINAYRQNGTYAMAIRLLPQDIPACDQLGIPRSLQHLITAKSGLLLCTGATGSGKSTTLASLVAEINRTRAVHILTMEDPVEYRYTSGKALIHQREIGRDTENFTSALKSALREDPDVLLVGELRDATSMAITLTAAETGHLVLATMHTKDSISCINRFLHLPQQEIIRLQLAETLLAVSSQRLLPKAEGRGRIAAFEVLVINDALRNLIREGKTQQLASYMETGGRFGMRTMSDAVNELRRKREIGCEK